MRSLVKTAVLMALLPLAFGDVEIQGKGSTFIVTYTPDYPPEHRTIVNLAAQFWADWLVSDVPIRVDAITSSYWGSDGWGEASQTIKPEGVINFPNAPLTDTYYPIALANSIAGQDLNPNNSDMKLNFKTGSFTDNNYWHMPLGARVPHNQYSFYFTVLQEMAHGLGLISMGNIKTGEKFNGKNDIYWTKIYSLSHDEFISNLSARQIKRAIEARESFGFKGEHSWADSAHLRSGREKNTLLLWNSPYQNELTFDHLSYAVYPRQIMTVDPRNHIPEYEITLGMLEDLGWRTTRNVAPIIEAQRSISFNEDNSYDISLADLTITDETPDELSLTTNNGAHYTRSGNRITPDKNFNGTLTVPVSVADEQFTSNTFNLSITVNSVNDAPVVTGQQNLSISEDNSLSLKKSHFTISDVDSNSFSLKVLTGSHYTVNGNKITPAANFNGTLDVGIKISDGSLDSSRFTAKVTVNAVNDAPYISAQNTLSTAEDKALTLTTSNFTIADVDSSSFTLQVLAGSNYTSNGNTLTPKANFSGTLNVPVRVSDGSANSNTFNASINVAAVNDAPLITQQLSVTTPEDTSLTLTTSHFKITDVDSSQFSLEVQAGLNYTASGTTITPAKDFTGSLSIPVKVSDGALWSNLFTTNLTVTEVNDAPKVLAQQSISSEEDVAFTLNTAQFTIEDADSTSFSLEVLGGDNYQFSGTKITPEQNFNGTLKVALRINDGISNSDIYYAEASISAVNDAPVIASQKQLTTLEDVFLAIKLSDLTIADVDSNNFSITVIAGESYTAENGGILPALDFNGALTVPVQVNDGELDSEAFNLAINVSAVNDAPVLFETTNIELDEDKALTLSPELFDFIDVDSDTFTVVSQTGEHYRIENQQIIPEAHFNGEISVPVMINDGQANSNAQTLKINYRPINDAPQLQSVAAQSIYEDESLFISQEMLSIFDPDNEAFSIHIARGEHYEVAGLEIIPDEHWFGQLSINLSVDDGELTSNALALNLIVESVNDVPVITTQALNQSQIYRQWQAQLTAEDVEQDALTFSVIEMPSWLSLSEAGLLTAYPNENMVGEHRLEIAVSDGQAKTSSQFNLTVQDDPTATNLSAALAIERTIWATDAWIPVTLTVNNQGPMDSVTSQVSIEFNGQWQTQDKRCDVAQNSCIVGVSTTETLEFSVQETQLGSQNLTVAISHEGYDYQLDDNSAQLTLTFTNEKPTQPQYTVPAFGKGNVRAIGIANIQGGRWPEILFANGPTQASTAYKFDGSFFRPVLHSHLADASDSNALAIFDFDNDGDKDWVLANGNNEGNTLYRNNGDGFFTYAGSLGEYDSRSVAYADLDRDGDKDLVFANNRQPNTLYLNNGNGEFELFAEFKSRRSCRVLIHDFNGDGRPDIFFANRGFRHRILFNRGFGRARANFKTTATEPASPVSFGAMDFGDANDLASEAMLADLDGDGVASDLVLANEASDVQSASLKVFSISAQETVNETARIETAAISDLSTGDYDGDGIDDIAVLRPGGALEVMQPRQGSLQTTEVMDTDGADTIVMVDVDGSGQADIISANNKTNAARLDFAGEVNDNIEGDSEQTMAPNESAESDTTSASDTQQQAIRVELSASKAGAVGGGYLLAMALVALISRRKPKQR